MTVPTKEDAKKALDRIGTTVADGGWTSLFGISTPVPGSDRLVRGAIFEGNGVYGDVDYSQYPSDCTRSFDQVWPTIQSALENGNEMDHLSFYYGSRKLWIKVRRHIATISGPLQWESVFGESSIDAMDPNYPGPK
ncbi:hypothetical protein [Glycomyces sp. NPDC048151]|uniref:hypothetical protein n=1 Tax=Glycomyces sp. NPDC048151 TaxID=3364002 RepID=UPI003720B7DA